MFLDQIYGTEHRGWAAIVSRNPETGDLDQQRWIHWPQERTFVEKYIDMRSDEDVYFSVALFSDKVRTSEDGAAYTRVVWADADTCDPENFLIEPTIQIETSPGRWHVLWLLDKAYPAVETQMVARAIAYKHRDQGCDTGWTASKILRIPGTTNTKREDNAKVSLIKDTGVVYTLEELEAAYPTEQLDIQALEEVGDKPTAKNSVATSDEIDKWIDANGLADLYLEEPKDGQSWSERLRRLEMELFRSGATAQEVFRLCKSARCNKYNPEFTGKLTQQGVPIPKRRDPDGVLWQDVSRAYAVYQAEQNVILPKPTAYTTYMSLLSMEERELIRDNPTWVDRYVDWVLTRSPDHAIDFSYTFAYQVLACAYADKVTLDLYGLKHPNLWTFIAAGSSRNHKSTARKAYLDMVFELERRTEDKIHIGDDFTVEKLVPVLGARDKEVSLIDIDEVQGWFQQVANQKYRSGTYTTLNKLYDGDVPVVLRATEGKGNETRAETVMEFAGTGIFDQIARTLTPDDFTNGFMLRSVWAVADAPPYRKGDGDLPERERKITERDEFFFSLVEELSENQSRYDRDYPQFLDWDYDARLRMNQFTHEISKYAIESGEQLLQPYTVRLRDHVARAAALLSYHHKLDSIGLFEVQVAIAQGERWLKSFEKLLTQVSNSDFGRRCDELEAFLASGKDGKRLESQIFQKFSYRLREFNEIRNTLQKQGRIRSAGEQTWHAL